MNGKPVGYLMTAIPDIGDQQYWIEVCCMRNRKGHLRYSRTDDLP